MGDWGGTLESLGILLGWVAGLYAAIVWLFFWDTREVVQWRLGSDLGVWAKPHDCEFFTPPMGNKHCHYRPVEVRPLEDAPGVGWIEWQKYED